MRVPRHGCSTSRSSSLVTMVSAPEASASSRYLSSLGSRQSVTWKDGSNQTASPRNTARTCSRRSREMACANLGLDRTAAISASTVAESAKTSASSARSKARSGTLSALSAALTTAEASKTINRRRDGRGAPCCTPPTLRRHPHRSDRPRERPPSARRWPGRAGSARIADAERG